MNKFFNKNNKGLVPPKLRKSEGGFTLIETLFAILIFSSSLAALLVVSGGGINSTVFAKNQLVASFLAQEGIEMVRNIRDNNFLDGGEWSDFDNDMTNCVNGECAIDPINSVLTPIACSVSGCDFLKYDSGNGFYGYSGSDTIFQRTITVYFSSIYFEAIVISKVSWNHGSTPHTITFKENLFEVTW